MASHQMSRHMEMEHQDRSLIKELRPSLFFLFFFFLFSFFDAQQCTMHITFYQSLSEAACLLPPKPRRQPC